MINMAGAFGGEATVLLLKEIERFVQPL